MAVVDVREIPRGRGGSVERNWSRTYSRVFQLITNDKWDSAVTIRAALPVNIGDSYQVNDLLALHEEDTGSYLARINISCVTDDGLQWEAQCEYSPYETQETRYETANPIDWPIQISWGNATYQKAADKKIDGTPILNSAGDRFDPPPTIDGNRPLLRIVRNEATFSPAIAAQFADAVNEFEFFGEAPRTWKCKPILADLQFNRDAGTADGYYYTVTYELEYNSETWDLKILQQGLREKNLAGNLVAIVDDKGLPVTSPRLLASDGFKLAAGGTPTYLTVEVYPKVDFGLLAIDPAGAPGQGWYVP